MYRNRLIKLYSAFLRSIEMDQQVLTGRIPGCLTHLTSMMSSSESIFLDLFPAHRSVSTYICTDRHIRHQNNFASQPTQVRVVVHLQDIRIVVLGVLISTPSLFVNPNAHMLLHPPQLRGVLEPIDSHGIDRFEAELAEQNEMILPEPADASNSLQINVDRPETAQDIGNLGTGRGKATTSSISAEDFIASTSVTSSISLRRNTLSSLIPGRGSRSYSANNTQETVENQSRLGGLLTTVRSRDRDTSPLIRIRSREHRDQERSRTSEDGGRRWSLTRSRSRNVPAVDSAVDQPASPPLAPAARTEPVPLVMPTVPERQHSESSNQPIEKIKLPRLLRKRNSRPYAFMSRPQANELYRRYPNYTISETVVGSDQAPLSSDTRLQHEELEDDEVGVLWSAGEAHWGSGGTKMAEWDAGAGVRRRWVGPMM